nr:MAG TPA: hypothetical protein [Caudoviricetes sp.]
MPLFFLSLYDFCTCEVLLFHQTLPDTELHLFFLYLFL